MTYDFKAESEKIAYECIRADSHEESSIIIEHSLREAAAAAYANAEEMCVMGSEATFISEGVRQDRKRTGKLFAAKAASLREGGKE